MTEENSAEDSVGKQRDRAINAELRCGICREIHPVRLDRDGKEFVSLSCMGSGSNVFPRTPFGKRIFHKWKTNVEDGGKVSEDSHMRRGLRSQRANCLGLYLALREKD